MWPESITWAKQTFVVTPYPNINQWNLSTLIYDKWELKFFLNWKIIWKDNYFMSWSFLEKKELPFRVGYGYKLEYFKWIIDDVKIYNRALTEDEIKQQAKVAWIYDQ